MLWVVFVTISVTCTVSKNIPVELENISPELRDAPNKHTRPILDVEALGETVKLGDFYDARLGVVVSGLSLWTEETLEEHVEETPTVYSNIEVVQEEKKVDKSYLLDIDANMKLKFLFGLVKISGSARLVRQQSSTADVARVTLKYHATTKTKTLPLTTPQDHAKYCSLVNTPLGPTHVITSVTYGLRSYIELRKVIKSSENKQSITGSLGIVMKALPNFNPDTSVDIERDLGLDPENDAYFEYSGDVILDKMPADFMQAVEVFDLVNEKAQASETLIKYQVTPVEYFCEGATPIMEEISKTIQDLANQISTDLDDLASQVKSLLRSDAAIRFPSIKNELKTFQTGLFAYTTVTKANIAASIVSKLSGQAVESEILKKIEGHMETVWNKVYSDKFLAYRTREIKTIELVTEAAQKNPELVLSDAGGSHDNQCIFSHKHATVYDLYVLPPANVAKMFISKIKDIAGIGTKDEDKWFNNLALVNRVGTLFQRFLTFAQNNFDSDHCFLVRLNELSKKKTDYATITQYRNGAVYEGAFDPPTPPPGLTCVSSTFSSIVLSVGEKTVSTRSHVTGLEVQAIWKKAKPDTAPDGNDKDQPIEYEEFPTTFQFGDVNSVELADLNPNTNYDIKIRYKVGDSAGVSPWSSTISCKTASTSAPVFLKVESQTTESLGVSWQPPQLNEAEDLIYSVVAEGEVEGNVHRQRIETENHKAELTGLLTGVVYHVTVTPVNNGVNNQAVRIVTATLPYPPDRPTVRSLNSVNSVDVMVDFSSVRLQDGMTVHSVEFKYHKVNQETMTPVGATEQRTSVSIGSLVRAYANLPNIESGVIYQVTCALRLTINGRLVSTDDSVALIITVPANNPAEDDGLRREITNFAASTKSTLDPMVTTSDSLHQQAQDLNDEIEDKIAGLNEDISAIGVDEADGVNSGVARRGCVRRGVSYQSGDEDETHAIPDAESEFACLYFCSQRFTDTLSVTYIGSGNTSSPVGSQCYCFTARHGLPTELNPGAVSIDRECWDVIGVRSEEFRKCGRFNWDLESKDIVSEEGSVTSSIYDCARLCTGTTRNFNIALNQPVSQTSSQDSASNAVDGNIATVTRVNALAGQAMWKVTLPRAEYIDSVVVYYDSGDSARKLDGAEVVVDGRSFGTITVFADREKFTVPVDKTGQEIGIRKSGGDYLTLTEVEVYGGDCKGVVYEWETSVCHMKGSEKSDRSYTLDMGRTSLYTSCLRELGAFGTVEKSWFG